MITLLSPRPCIHLVVPAVDTSLWVNADWVKVQISLEWGGRGGKSCSLYSPPVISAPPLCSRASAERRNIAQSGNFASGSGSALPSITQEWVFSPQLCGWLKARSHTLISGLHGPFCSDKEHIVDFRSESHKSSHICLTSYLTLVLSTLPMPAWYISEKLDFFDLATMGTRVPML